MSWGSQCTHGWLRVSRLLPSTKRVHHRISHTLPPSPDRDIDASPDNLKFDTPYAGYFPSAAIPQMVCTTGSTLAFIGYGAAKIVCLSPLALASGSVAGAWVGAEFLVLLAVRAARGQWRLARPGMDGAGVSLSWHFGLYLCMLGCPFTFLRVSE